MNQRTVGYPSTSWASCFLFALGTPLWQWRKTLHEWKDNSGLAKRLAACTHLSSTVSQLFEPQVQKIAVFTYLNPHFFVSPGDAPATITQYVAWMERQFNACQTLAACTYIFNSFRVIRCLTQCVSPKIAILPHICFPWEHPWGNHAKCSMDGKIIRCLQIVSLHVPSNYNRFWDTARYWSKIVIFSYHPCTRRRPY